MVKFSKEFFSGFGEILLIGELNKYKWFMSEISRSFTKHGIKIIPFSLDETGPSDGKVYRDWKELPRIPDCAYLITDLTDSVKMVEKPKEYKVKKILFNSKNVADQALLDQCAKAGIETAVACPLLVFGGGLHRMHGFFAGY